MPKMYTVAKLAKLLGVSEADVKKIIQAEEIEPDEVRGGSKYYSRDTAEEIEALLEED
jgi:predicted transcriptional regulator